MPRDRRSYVQPMTSSVVWLRNCCTARSCASSFPRLEWRTFRIASPRRSCLKRDFHCDRSYFDRVDARIVSVFWFSITAVKRLRSFVFGLVVSSLIFKYCRIREFVRLFVSYLFQYVHLSVIFLLFHMYLVSFSHDSWHS